MSKLFNEKNILFFLSFFLIIFVLINFTHNKYPKFKNIDESSYRLLNNFEFKSNINSILVSDLTYERFLTKKCATTGDMHDRHKVRWVKAFFLKNVFQFTSKINKNLPYYVNIILHSLIIFLTLIILNKTLNLKKKYIIFYLLFVTFIFQNYLGEYSFSIFEMFFLALALYASKTKNIFLFFGASLLAVLNRESGFILLFTWLIFNEDYKKFLIISLVTLTIFIFLNLNTINCMINPKFFVPLEHQSGQINLSDLSSISFFPLMKLLLINYLIPFGIIAYNVIKNKITNKFFILISFIYFLIFLIAIPAHHMAVKLILLPLIILSFNLPLKKI